MVEYHPYYKLGHATTGMLTADYTRDYRLERLKRGVVKPSSRIIDQLCTRLHVYS